MQPELHKDKPYHPVTATCTEDGAKLMVMEVHANSGGYIALYCACPKCYRDYTLYRHFWGIIHDCLTADFFSGVMEPFEKQMGGPQ
ncbi:MAG TPA: hypothetical protein VNJ52_04900 [Patescibacteria group bacterium]|nr:hypothetical protein [Patescibacteria group bacterium]